MRNVLYWLRNRLMPAPIRDLEHGDLVEPGDIERIYRKTLAEDGRLCVLYDLRCGRTGAHAFFPGDKPGPITVAD